MLGLWTGSVLKENSEYLTRVWDFHLSHQQETCIRGKHAQSLRGHQIQIGSVITATEERRRREEEFSIGC